MDKHVIKWVKVVYLAEEYTIQMLQEEGTDNFSVELWNGVELLFANDWLLEGQANELFTQIHDGIEGYVEAPGE